MVYILGDTVHCSGEHMVAGAGGYESHYFLLRKLKVVNAHLSTRFLLCIQLRSPACGAVPTIFRMGLPTSVYLIWKIPHRLVQKMCLVGASVKLTITLICHRGKLLEKNKSKSKS